VCERRTAIVFERPNLKFFGGEIEAVARAWKDWAIGRAEKVEARFDIAGGAGNKIDRVADISGAWLDQTVFV